MGILEWLSSASLVGGHLIIEGMHVFIMVPLLVTELGIDPVVCRLESVLYIGFTLLEGSQQNILDLDLTFS